MQESLGSPPSNQNLPWRPSDVAQLWGEWQNQFLCQTVTELWLTSDRPWHILTKENENKPIITTFGTDKVGDFFSACVRTKTGRWQRSHPGEGVLIQREPKDACWALVTICFFFFFNLCKGHMCIWLKNLLSPALMDAHGVVRARLKSLVQTQMHAHLLAKATAEKLAWNILASEKSSSCLKFK